MGNHNEANEIFQIVRTIFMEKIPFNRILGIEIEMLEKDRACLKFAMRDELIGNFIRGTLHGGVISSVLDVTGGLVAFLGVYHQMEDEPREKKIARFSKLGTIDIRVDYLRPGIGKWFRSTGYILRTGNKVAVTRIELHNDERCLIAVGTGAYVIS